MNLSTPYWQKRQRRKYTIENAMTETELLLTSILDCPRHRLYDRDIAIDTRQQKRLSEALLLRSQGIPLQYILGETEFFGLNFKVKSNIFIPRPETELLVEEIIRMTNDEGRGTNMHILDIGTGSGCIAITLAKFLPYAKITAVDISPEALAIAKENAALNTVRAQINFVQSDLFPNYKLQTTNYELIVSNPPYIPSGDIKGLQREIHCEPRLALDGGEDGLDFYRRIIDEAPQFLKPGGLLMMEMGYGQGNPIRNIFEKRGNFEIIEIVKDYNGIERVIVAKLKES